MQTKSSFDILSLLSKATIIIPIVIIILAFLLKVLPEKKVDVTSIQPQSKVIPTEKPIVSVSAKLDLKGPWICDYSSKESTISAYIKDKKIYAKFKKNKELENFLLNGDCIYNWDKGENTGKKFCGISSYIGIFESLQSLNLFDLSTIFSYLPNLGIDIGIKDQDIDWNKVCQKGKVDENIFVMPRKVVFKEVSLLTPSQ